MKPLITKVCGITRATDFLQLEKLTVDWAGFIFYSRSPRYVVNKLNPSRLPASKLKRIGVFVNAEASFIRTQIENYQLDKVQLHGEESPEFCAEIRKIRPVIKAFRIKNQRNLKSCAQYVDSCDYFLFDTAGKTYGGTGKRFDWELLKNYHEQTPFFLSGGIGPTQVSPLKNFSHPQWAGIDLNSKFEKQPGKKDFNLLKPFLCQLRP